MTNEIASATIAAGWYPDPGNAANLRWWNGVQWSEHTRPVFEVPIPATPVYESPTHPAPTHPAPTHSAPTFSPYNQAVNPYAPGNPYATSPYAVSSTPSNGWATWSLLLGILSAAFTLVVVFTGGASIILSTSGVFAIVNGIRALGLVSQGRATARIRPIFGIALGAVGTLIMVGSFFGLFSHPSYSTSGYDSAPSSSTPNNSAQTPAPLVKPVGPTGPGALPDASIDDYTALPVQEAAALSLHCDRLVTPTPTPLVDNDTRSSVALEKDDMTYQLQQAARDLEMARNGSGWPTVIYHDPKTEILFTGDCRTIGLVPKGAAFAYAMSPDHMNVAMAFYDKENKVGELFRTLDRGIYTL